MHRFAASHTRTVPGSYDPLTDTATVGENKQRSIDNACMAAVGRPAPCRWLNPKPASSSHTLPLTIRRPSGEYATLVNPTLMAAEASQLLAAGRIPHPHGLVGTTR